MTTPSDTPDEDLDRVVSRRVDNPTSADADDERAYAAADPGSTDDTDTDSGGGGGESERAARDVEGENQSEPTRSE